MDERRVRELEEAEAAHIESVARRLQQQDAAHRAATAESQRRLGRAKQKRRRRAERNCRQAKATREGGGFVRLRERTGRFYTLILGRVSVNGRMFEVVGDPRTSRKQARMLRDLGRMERQCRR